jgi:hypothetical protein
VQSFKILFFFKNNKTASFLLLHLIIDNEIDYRIHDSIFQTKRLLPKLLITDFCNDAQRADVSGVDGYY